jgi:glycosyltransferase involved in cell wall biosynthesis
VKKVLIITYYWPPSGGAGVQRTLHFAKYLGDYNCIPYVLTVDPTYASYPVKDESLKALVPKNLNISYTKSFEALNILSAIAGKDKVPYGGFTNQKKSSFFQDALKWIRGNFFIPDARIGWVKYATKKAAELIREHQIDCILISSPPHSSQLIGLKLKKEFPHLKWIADLRDPWTDIYYYKELLHTEWAKKKDRSLEKKVLERADAALVVSSYIKYALAEKSLKVNVDKIHVLPNGYDEGDFKSLDKKDSDKFYITYVGTMADSYKPSVFFEALAKVIHQNNIERLVFRFVGSVPVSIKEKLNELGINSEFIGHVAHQEAVRYMLSTNLLLLVIPDAPGAEGILTGKLFEYLGAGKRIIGIGPSNGDAATILKECSAGVMFDRNDKTGLLSYLSDEIMNDRSSQINSYEVKKYTRRQLTNQLSTIISNL